MRKILLSLALACSVAALHAQTIMLESFSGATTPAMPTGWSSVNTGTGGNGWETTTGTTTLYSTTVPNTGTHTAYARVDEYIVHQNNATMTSAVFDLSAATDPYLSYDYIYGGYHLSAAPNTWEAAWVEFTDDGSTWNFLDSIPRTIGNWATRYVQLPATASTTCQLRFRYSDNGSNLVGVVVDEINVFNAQANSLRMESVTPKAGDPQNDFKLSGGTVTFGGVVRNLSPTAITGFNVGYQVGTGAVVPGVITGVSIAPMATYTFTVASPYTVTTMGTETVLVGANISGDTDNSDDTMRTAVNGVASMPAKRMLAEEGTGIWCGFCVRGIIYMDSLWLLHSDKVSIVAVHDKLNGTDPLASENSTTLSYDKFVTNNISGYPSVIYDRRYASDPTNAFIYYNNSQNNYFAFANMSIGVIQTSSTITASVTVTPATDLNGDYRLAMVITEDDVHNTASSYGQHNYYGIGGAYNSSPMKGMGYSFNDSATTIPASSCYYQFVDRYTVPDFMASPNGVAGSLPATMATGTNYNYTFSPVTIGTTWAPSKLRVVVMMLDNNPNSFTYGQVLNSINGVVAAVSVSDVKAGVESLRVFPNPAQNTAHVAFELKTAGEVKFTITDFIGRAVYTSAAEHMTAGGQQLNFSVADLAAGVYNITVYTTSGSITEKLTVTK